METNLRARTLLSPRGMPLEEGGSSVLVPHVARF